MKTNPKRIRHCLPDESIPAELIPYLQSKVERTRVIVADGKVLSSGKNHNQPLNEEDFHPAPVEDHSLINGWQSSRFTLKYPKALLETLQTNFQKRTTRWQRIVYYGYFMLFGILLVSLLVSLVSVFLMTGLFWIWVLLFVSLPSGLALYLYENWQTFQGAKWAFDGVYQRYPDQIVTRRYLTNGM